MKYRMISHLRITLFLITTPLCAMEKDQVPQSQPKATCETFKNAIAHGTYDELWKLNAAHLEDSDIQSLQQYAKERREAINIIQPREVRKLWPHILALTSKLEQLPPLEQKKFILDEMLKIDDFLLLCTALQTVPDKEKENLS